jgi:hypothetical protein
LNIFLSKDNKNLVYLDFKTLLEEVFPSLLVIQDINALNMYNLQFFPPEVVIMYYSSEVINHPKLHNLIFNSKYFIFVTTENLQPLFQNISLENKEIMNLNFNKTFIDWFAKKTFSYLKTKHGLSLNYSPQEQSLITSFIVSKKTSPLRFCKNFYFLQDLSATINYINQMDQQYKAIKDNNYNNGFMHFYRNMMLNYGQKSQDTPMDVVVQIIFFHQIYS